MWQMLRSLTGLNPGLNEVVQETTQTITRTFTYILAALLILAACLAGMANPADTIGPIFEVVPLVLLTTWLSLRLLEKSPVAACTIWQAGMMASTALAIARFENPQLAFIYILLPIVAATSCGWPLALASSSGVIAIMTGMGFAEANFNVDSAQRVIVSGGAALAGLLTSIGHTTLLGVVQRSAIDSRQARDQMEEFRRQRVALFQTQEDLLNANRELARLSDRMKSLTQVAEDARRVKEEFVANVSHELRTPLNMIIGFSELIAKAPGIYGSLPPALLADIAAIQRNSQHLSDLVNDVLDLSQIEAGRMALVKDWATLQELAAAAVSATQVLFEMKGLYLRSEMPADPVRIFCDSTRIREVLLNLLSNAGRFTTRGGVTLRAWMEEDRLVVCVMDTGPGIAPEDQKRLFQPFQQLDNSIRREGGSGLGLSISKRFVELHEGKMWLESQPGEGTSFFFSLPAYLTDIALAPVGARRWITPYSQPDRVFSRSKVPAPSIAPRFVLLDRGNALRRMFSRYTDDVEISCVTSLEDARLDLQRTPAQALIINSASLEVSSQEIERLDLPFVTPIVTCEIASEDDTARRLGVAKYLVKPIRRDQLIDTLAELQQGLGREIKTILLVDDQIELLQLFARMLASSEQRYSVLRARDGQQALEILRERRPDAILLDLVMPGMDGFQVLAEKNSDETIRDIPAVVISSRDPSGAPIISSHLSISRSGGLSANDLLGSIRSVTKILAGGGSG